MSEPETTSSFATELDRISQAMESQGMRYLILADVDDETLTAVRHNEADLARWFDHMITEQPEYALTLMSAFSQVQEKILRGCLDSAGVTHPQHEHLVGLVTQPIGPNQFAINWFEMETLEPRGVGIAVLYGGEHYIPYDYKKDGMTDEEYKEIPESERLWSNLVTKKRHHLTSVTDEGPQFTPVE